MKNLLAIVLGLSTGLAAWARCNDLPAALNVQSLSFVTADLSGDYLVTVNFPDLKNTNCSVENSVRSFKFAPEEKIEITYTAQRLGEVTQRDAKAGDLKWIEEASATTQSVLICPSKLGNMACYQFKIAKVTGAASTVSRYTGSELDQRAAAPLKVEVR